MVACGIKVVRGKKKWKKEFARFAELSAPDYFPALMGPRIEEALEYIYTKKGSIFGYDKAYFAKDGKELIGAASVYDHEDKRGSTFSMAIYFFQSMGLSTFGQAAPLLKADFKMARTKPNQTYFCNFGVDPDHRCKGAGSAILNRAIEDARKKGKTHMVLDVETWNKRAMKLYKRTGFEKDGNMFKIRIRGVDYKFYRLVKEL